MSIPFNTLLEESKCYLCLGISQAEAMELALLNRISEGGGSSEPLVYRALLTQASTNDPTVVIIENTLGNISWVRDDIGTYLGILVGAFPAARTLAMISNNSTSPGSASYGLSVSSDDQLTLITTTFNNSTDGMTNSLPIDIRVYQ